MKFTNIIYSILILAQISCSNNDSKESKLEPTKDTTTETKEEMIARLGADKYGMSQYVMAFLKKGPNRDQDSTEAAQIQEAHMANIGRMADAGQLVLAGPFLDDGEYQGIYIFNVSNIEEARKLTESDPAIKAGRLIMELKPWYGSAAVKDITRIHKLIATDNP